MKAIGLTLAEEQSCLLLCLRKAVCTISAELPTKTQLCYGELFYGAIYKCSAKTVDSLLRKSMPKTTEVVSKFSCKFISSNIS